VLGANSGVFSFIGACIVGVVVPNAGLVRTPLVNGLFGAILGYVLSCAIVLILGILVNLVAPLFGGRRDFDSAFKSRGLFLHAGLARRIFLVLPGLQFLTLTGLYGAYILWLGLPRLIKSPGQRSLGFATLIVVCAFALAYFAAWRNAWYSARRDFDFVMAGLVPAIHAYLCFDCCKTWMPATSAGMTITAPSRSVCTLSAARRASAPAAASPALAAAPDVASDSLNQ